LAAGGASAAASTLSLLQPLVAKEAIKTINEKQNPAAMLLMRVVASFCIS
jgi:hypothetical protein